MLIVKPYSRRHNSAHFHTIYLKIVAEGETARFLDTLPLSIHAIHAEEIKGCLHEIVHHYLQNENHEDLPFRMRQVAAVLWFIDLLYEDAGYQKNETKPELPMLECVKKYIDTSFNSHLTTAYRREMQFRYTVPVADGNEKP